MFELRPLPYDHPDARELTEQAQTYYVEIYGGRDDDPLAAAEFAPPHGGFVIGYLDGVPAAMGGWLFTPELGREQVAQIRRMFVVGSARRRGLAQAVLAHLEADATKYGARTMILATGQPQVEAIALYRTHGYADIAPFGYYAAADLVVCLGKELGDLNRPMDRPAAAGPAGPAPAAAPG